MTNPDFARMVPGFEFLQDLMKGAGSSLPGMGSWIAPTLDAGEVDKRIQELRTVQFWLEQNARMLAATIQALEVQRMTLATLQTMNVPMSELRESMRMGAAAAAPAPAPAAAHGEPLAREKKKAENDEKDEKGAQAGAKAAAPAVDPLQWWGAITRQFTELATKAMQDMPVEAASAFANAKPAAAHTANTARAARPDPASAEAGRCAPARKGRGAAKRPAAAKAGSSGRTA